MPVGDPLPVKKSKAFCGTWAIIGERVKVLGVRHPVGLRTQFVYPGENGEVLAKEVESETFIIVRESFNEGSMLFFNNKAR